MTRERSASSLARPPALRITWASPSASPAYLAGSRRASMHVRIVKWRAEAPNGLAGAARASGRFPALPENADRELPRPPREVAFLIREPERRSGALTVRISRLRAPPRGSALRSRSASAARSPARRRGRGGRRRRRSDEEVKNDRVHHRCNHPRSASRRDREDTGPGLLRLVG